MKRQYGLGRKTINKALLFFKETDKTTIKFLTNQIAWFKDWICAAIRPISALWNGNREADEKWEKMKSYKGGARWHKVSLTLDFVQIT